MNKKQTKKVLYAAAAAAALMTGGCMTQKNSEMYPAPGHQEEVLVQSEHGNLYGTIDLPEGKGPFPAVLIISGSGPTDRDGNSELMKKPNDSLKMTGAWIASFGTAALRYDKRGVGASKDAAGITEETVFEDMIYDAALWIKYLKNDPRFSSIGVLGHSEGALVGMCAAKQEGADFYISISGAGRPITEVLREQLASQPKFVTKKSGPILDEIEKGNRVDDVPKILKNLFKPELQPYVISWNQYDPEKIIADLDMPVLIAQGSTDLQTSSKDAEILAEANSRSELAVIEGMNHVLKDAPPNKLKNLQVYTKPNVPLSAGFVESLEGFLKRNQMSK